MIGTLFKIYFCFVLKGLQRAPPNLPLDKVFSPHRGFYLDRQEPLCAKKKARYRRALPEQVYFLTLCIQNSISRWAAGTFLQIYSRFVLSILQRSTRICLLTSIFYSIFSPDDETATNNPTCRKLSLNMSITSGNLRPIVFRSQCNSFAACS